MTLALFFSTLRFLCVFVYQCLLDCRMLVILKLAHNYLIHTDVLKDTLQDSINPSSHIFKNGFYINIRVIGLQDWWFSVGVSTWLRMFLHWFWMFLLLASVVAIIVIIQLTKFSTWLSDYFLANWILGGCSLISLALSKTKADHPN